MYTPLQFLGFPISDSRPKLDNPEPYLPLAFYFKLTMLNKKVLSPDIPTSKQLGGKIRHFTKYWLLI